MKNFTGIDIARIMAIKFIFALTVLTIGTCVRGQIVDLTDVLEGIFTGQPNDDLGDLFVPTSPTLLSNEVESPFTKSCDSGEKCVPEYLCSNGRVKTDSDVTLINVRFLKKNNETACEFLQKCCSVEDTVTEPIVRPTSTSTGCGYRNTDGVGFRIGGINRESEFGEFPWMLAILRGRNESDTTHEIYQCGGSLIHPKVVLTAAHCVQGRPPKAFAVRAGEWETNTKTEILPDENRDVSDIVIHPNFNNRNLFNDVALMFLKSPFELAPHINTVCLPPSGYNFDFSKCTATGWGKDQFENGNYQNILKKIDLPLVPSYVCQDNLRTTVLGKYFKLDKSFICAGGERGIDTCEGDGGSPLVCPLDNTTSNRFYQAGIVAWGIGCGKENIPGVYVNVAEFRQWIDEQLEARKISIIEYLPE